MGYRPKWMANVSARDLGEKVADDVKACRSAFNRDYGVILHSNYFRRLAHKTQVHSLPGNDHVRTRLTHSLEVSQIGRQSARAFFEKVVRGKFLEGDEYFDLKAEFEELTAATCLAHDIGHPPFGHAGAEVLKSICPDFHKFDDNKQVPRILLNPILDEDLKPSGPLLAAILKKFDVSESTYPTDVAHVQKVLGELGLKDARHPASLIMEAADDIAYISADLMDYFTYFVSARKVTSEKHDELVQLLHKINVVPPCRDGESKTLGDLFAKARTSNSYKDFSDHLLRAALTHVLDAIAVFVSEYQKIDDLDGVPGAFSEFVKKHAVTFDDKGERKTDFNLAYLQIPGAGERGKAFFQIKKLMYKPLILDEEIIANQTLHAKLVVGGLWEFFTKEALGSPKTRDLSVFKILPPHDQGYILRAIDQGQDEAARAVCDLISGMTDRYANALWSSFGHPVRLRVAG